MNREIKAKWVAELRSGKYEQAQRCLIKVQRRPILRRQKRSFCCLGVLCEIAVADGVIKPAHATGADGWGYENREGTLPDRVEIWAGFHSGRYYFPNEGGRARSYSAMDLNDKLGLSFTEIADLVDKHVPVDEEEVQDAS